MGAANLANRVTAYATGPPKAQRFPDWFQTHLHFWWLCGNKWLNDLHVLDVGRLEESALNDVAVHTLIENMRRLLNSPDFSDITFLVEGKRIYAHKAILVAQCEHFHAMFSG